MPRGRKERRCCAMCARRGPAWRRSGRAWCAWRPSAGRTWSRTGAPRPSAHTAWWPRCAGWRKGCAPATCSPSTASAAPSRAACAPAAAPTSTAPTTWCPSSRSESTSRCVGWGGEGSGGPHAGGTLVWGCGGWWEVRHPSEGFILHPRPHGERSPHVGCVQVQRGGMPCGGDAGLSLLGGFHPDIWTGCCGIREPRGLGQDGQMGTGIEAEQLPGIAWGVFPLRSPTRHPVGVGLGRGCLGHPTAATPAVLGLPPSPARSHSSVKAVFLGRAGSRPGRRSRSPFVSCRFGSGGFSITPIPRCD